MARRKSIEVAVAPISFEPFAGRDPVAPESFNRSQSSPNVDWDGLVGNGENTQYTAQTPNGTAHESGNGANNEWSWGPPANGRRWGGRVNWAKNGGNRTGE